MGWLPAHLDRPVDNGDREAIFIEGQRYDPDIDIRSKGRLRRIS
jgi:hypothetical protein